MNVNSDGNQQRNNEGLQAVVDHMFNSKIDATVWLTRVGTVIFFIFCPFAMIIGNPWGCYKRSLLCNAAACSLCLHQNLQNVHLSEDFFNLLLMDDCFHYLLFSLTFLFSHHSILVLISLVLYNLWSCSQYSLEILNKLGEGTSSIGRFFRNINEHYENDILTLVAWAEVLIMPLSIVMLLTGYGSLWEPFMYYQFLSLRYASRTGTYTREVFHELKVIVETYADNPSLPDIIRQFLRNMISFISQLSPMVPSLQ